MVRPLVSLLSLLLMVPAALAAPPKRDEGTRVILHSDEGPGLLAIPGLSDPDHVDTDQGFSLGVRGRYITVPNAVFEIQLLDYTSFDAYSLGLEFGIDGPAGGRIIFGIDYSDLSMPSGNFRNELDRPNQASYTEVDLHMIAVDVLFLWTLELAKSVGFVYGAGVGVAYTPGTIVSTDVFPTCEVPVSECGHFRDVTEREQKLPTRWWPLLTVQAGLYWDPVPGFRLRFEGGFRGVLFAGMSARTTF